MFEKKTQLASVSIGFNSQLRVLVTGSGPMREGSGRHIVPGPDSYGEDRPVTSLRHQGGEEFSERGTIFLTMSNSF